MPEAFCNPPFPLSTNASCLAASILEPRVALSLTDDRRHNDPSSSLGFKFMAKRIDVLVRFHSHLFADMLKDAKPSPSLGDVQPVDMYVERDGILTLMCRESIRA